MNRHFKQLAELYRTMDTAWDRAAAGYGFQCNGCKDNCCLSLFYHHTQVEKAYLLHGFSTLPKAEQKNILEKAENYCSATFAQEDGGIPESKKVPCPLLTNGRCGLYPYRPMICRMHGLPHELHKPGAPPIKGPGCAAGNFDNRDYIPFDRTPFYRDMAGVEMGFRAATGRNGKIKQTIAEILLTPN
ncbi:MAG: YkgJ family cysteine cluster protein [Desulfobacter sp.]|nr:MAG: YkgJ family cysteine cluster protein [Desulfobacter sp.]